VDVDGYFQKPLRVYPGIIKHLAKGEGLLTECGNRGLGKKEDKRMQSRCRCIVLPKLVDEDRD
jgi:hypothetical protein